jgi:hypothetical protein
MGEYAPARIMWPLEQGSGLFIIVKWAPDSEVMKGRIRGKQRKACRS